MKTRDIFLIFFIFIGAFFCGHVWAMQTMNVTTGYGYLSYNGQVLADYQFSPGNYQICNGMTQTEVANASQLNSQQVNFAAYLSFFNNPGCQ